ncbi:hypothetical protein M2352_002888 [Azospirillum fermentarium]|uniref:esterase-like activity of phytase family protein n=1 Tax=Azospirillum fermentarium TaxID=1233114 RepID=UPI0022280AA7|nr:esterase-like activity of phytase family protein [Azospirillum fermentarium]MCW2247297.1 hypothetical protein [Azospirillum fermentarium]
MRDDRGGLGRWMTTLVALGMSVACAADTARRPPPSSVRPVVPDRVAPAQAGEPVRLGRLTYQGGIEIHGGAIGGLSGLSVFDGGQRFAAVSDHGFVVRGALTYDAGGWLAGASSLTARRLPGTQDKTLISPGDSEDILRLPDGGWLVSFEGTPRVWRYPPAIGESGTLPVPVPVPADTATSPPNGGLEAMALFPDGRFLLLEEGEDDGVPERRGWLAPSLPATADGWQRVTYRARPHYRPTSAAALPDGGLLVLERYFSLLGGWGSRLVRVPAAAVRPGAVLEGEEVARIGPPLPLDNYEGLSVRTGPDGRLLVYLVSDDNFSPLQRTLLLMFSLDP